MPVNDYPLLRNTTKQTPKNKIREAKAEIPAINKWREANGLLPLTDLTLGSPHVVPNETILREFVTNLYNIVCSKDKKTLVETFKYPPVQGSERVRGTISSYLNFLYQALGDQAFSADEVMPISGATQGFHGAISALSVNRNKGEGKVKVALFKPVYSSHMNQLNVEGDQAVLIDLLQGENHAHALARSFTAHPDIDIVVLNDPHNPDGHKFTREQLKDIGDILLDPKHEGVAIIHERVYGAITREPNPDYLLDVVPELKAKRPYIEILSLSKDASIPGGRVGMLAANKVRDGNGKEYGLIDPIKDLLFHEANVVSVQSCMLLEAFLLAEMADKNQDWKKTMQFIYSANVNGMKEALTRMGMSFINGNLPGASGGTFYLAPQVPWIGKPVPDRVTILDKEGNPKEFTGMRDKIGHVFTSDKDIAKFLFYMGVATVPLSAFEMDPKMGGLRISCAADEKDLARAATIIEHANGQVLAREKEPLMARL